MRGIVTTPVAMQGIMAATVVWAEARQYFEPATLLESVTLLRSWYLFL